MGRGEPYGGPMPIALGKLLTQSYRSKPKLVTLPKRKSLFLTTLGSPSTMTKKEE